MPYTTRPDGRIENACYLTWRALADKVIAEVERKARLAGICDATDLLELVDAEYPFGERTMWPYKAWLKARKAFRQRVGLLPPAPRKPRPEPPPTEPHPDQIDLFGTPR